MKKDLRTQVNKEERCLESPLKRKKKNTLEHQDDTQNFLCKCKKTPTATEELWQIQCNICERWYHGKCHAVNEKMAKHIDRYRCVHCVIEKHDETEGEQEEADDDDEVIREKLLRAEIKEKDEKLKKKDQIIYGLENEIKDLKKALEMTGLDKDKDELLNKKEIIISGLENEIILLKREGKNLREERNSAEEALENGKTKSKEAFQKLLDEKDELQRRLNSISQEKEKEEITVNGNSEQIDVGFEEIEIDCWTSQESNTIDQLLNSNNSEAISTKTNDVEDNGATNQEEKKNKKQKKQDEQALVKENRNLKNKVKKLEEEVNEKDEKISEINGELDYYFMEVKLLRETKSALNKANNLLEKQARSYEGSPKKNNRGAKKKRRKTVCKYYADGRCKYGDECRYHHPDIETTDDEQPNVDASQRSHLQQEEHPQSPEPVRSPPPPPRTPPPPRMSRQSPQPLQQVHGCSDRWSRNSSPGRNTNTDANDGRKQQKECKFFLQGRCRYINSQECPFLHTQAQEHETPPTPENRRRSVSFLEQKNLPRQTAWEEQMRSTLV